MRKEKILEILENAKDGNGAVPMRLVRTAFGKLPEPCEDTISRQAAIDEIVAWTIEDRPDAEMPTDLIERISKPPSVQPESPTDTISRQAALSCFHAWVDKHGDVHEPDEMPEYRAIENLPAVQPERETGKWIIKIEGKPESGGTIGRYECPNCHKIAYANEFPNYFFDSDENWHDPNYCPNCGAKMEVGE